MIRYTNSADELAKKLARNTATLADVQDALAYEKALLLYPPLTARQRARTQEALRNIAVLERALVTQQ